MSMARPLSPEGTHEILLARGGLYARVPALQFASVDLTAEAAAE